MLNSIRSKQILSIGAIVLLVGFLFTRDIKGLVKPKEENGKGGPATAGQMPSEQAAEINLTEVSATAKNSLSPGIATEITSLEQAYSGASGEDKTVAAKALSQKWDDVEQTIPSALYLEIVANADKTLKNWIAAGDQFSKAYDNSRDTVLLPSLLQKANNAYASALSIDTANVDAKTGLGITIVNGMGMPMKGIAMLLDVVKKDPDNLKANMSLGTFAIKSGQFDKAIVRFKDIIAIKPSPDAYFYLATAYENLGKNAEAIDAYLQSKKLAANPTLSKFIDGKVVELKGKS
ncbi:MAG: tetratricopeptide repeat protein [Bacteroidota bacterium]